MQYYKIKMFVFNINSNQWKMYCTKVNIKISKEKEKNDPS